MAEDEVLLTDIFRKVTEELKNLETEKKVINDLIKQTRKQIGSLDRREAKLRSDIAALVGKEADLSGRKLELEKKLETTRKKFEKIAAAKKSLSEAF
jgi:chromosome segregation ATPase